MKKTKFNKLISKTKKYNINLSKIFLILFQITITFLLLNIVFKLNDTNFYKLIENVNISWSSIFGFIFFIIISTAICALRWNLIRRDLQLKIIKKLLLIETSALGNFVSSITPSGIIGDILKPFLIKKYTSSASLKKELFAIGIDKIFGLLSLILFLSILIPSLLLIRSIETNLFIFILVIFLVIILISSNDGIKNFLNSLKFKKFLIIKKNNFLFFLKSFLLNKNFILKKIFKIWNINSILEKIIGNVNKLKFSPIMTISLCNQIFFTLAFFILLNNENLSSVNFIDKIILSSLLLLATSLPITVGGWGLREIVIYLYPNINSNEVDFLLPIIFLSGFMITISNIILFFFAKLRNSFLFFK